MNPLHEFAALFSNFGNIDPRMIVMWVVGGVLVYLAIKKEMEPTLLLPMGFGTILVNHAPSPAPSPKPARRIGAHVRPV